MGDLFFVLKSVLITVAIVVLLQIKVGPKTAEDHFVDWLHHSAVTQQLQGVAEGAVKSGREGVALASQMLGLGKGQPNVVKKEEAGWLKIRRSDAYYKQKEREAQSKNNEAQSDPAD